MKTMKSIISMCCLLLFGMLAGAEAKTKIMEFNTGLAWSDSYEFLQGGLFPIGTDFLAIAINRGQLGPNGADPGDQILYFLDTKKRTLAKKIDVAGQGYYWVQPSATTSSFVLSYYDSESGDRYISLYGFNKKSRTWSTVTGTTQKVTTGYATASSTPLLPGYFVNTVSRNDTLWLDVYKY